MKTFAPGDRVAIVYTNTADATVKAVSEPLAAGDIRNEGRTAVLTVTLTDPKASGAVSYIYPAAMAAADGSVNYASLSGQDGTLATLASNLDLCTFTGTLASDATLPDKAILDNRLAIDEFQQIAYYPEKNVEATLRSHIQKMNNCLFIYAGSNRHILENMFNSAAKPFYNSAEGIYLDSIAKDVYTRFIEEQFEKADRRIAPEAASEAYDLFEGHTYYVHNVLHNAFAYINDDKTLEKSDIEETLSDILEEKGHSFASVMNQLNYQQKETLIAIAKDGKATGVTSIAFVKKHALKSPSSVQYAISTLLDKQLLTYHNEGRTKVYSVSDRFMEMWICRTY